MRSVPIFYINHRFNCDSLGVVYLITCQKCEKQYVGNTVTPFRKRFNNHKNSLNRFGKGQKEICGKHLYSHFYTEGHLGIKDLSVMIIDVTNVNNLTERESFWMEKLCTYILTGLNVREEFRIIYVKLGYKRDRIWHTFLVLTKGLSPET